MNERERRGRKRYRDVAEEYLEIKVVEEDDRAQYEGGSRCGIKNPLAEEYPERKYDL